MCQFIVSLKGTLYVKHKVTFNLFEFTILRCPCRLRWRMDVTNISPQITILRRGRTCAMSKYSNEVYSKVREDFTITKKALLGINPRYVD